MVAMKPKSPCRGAVPFPGNINILVALRHTIVGLYQPPSLFPRFAMLATFAKLFLAGAPTWWRVEKQWWKGPST